MSQFNEQDCFMDVLYFYFYYFCINVMKFFDLFAELSKNKHYCLFFLSMTSFSIDFPENVLYHVLSILLTAILFITLN